jgi:hypothetical protein
MCRLRSSPGYTTIPRGNMGIKLVNFANRFHANYKISNKEQGILNSE